MYHNKQFRKFTFLNDAHDKDAFEETIPISSLLRHFSTERSRA